MLRQKNEILEQGLCIILCAGRGKRFNLITQRIPKPLIRVKSLGNKPIVYDLINKLFKLEFKKLFLVTGYLGNQIQEYIKALNAKCNDPIKILKTYHSDNHYQKGPLFSFSSIFLKLDVVKFPLVLIFPGDTVFDISLLERIKQILINEHIEIKNGACVFYRKITREMVKLEQESESKELTKKLTVLEIEQKSNRNLLKLIKKITLKNAFKEETTKQMIPIIALSPKYTHYIVRNRNNFDVSSIWRVLNHMISNGFEFFAYLINSEYMFYDIDSELDLKKLELIKKKEGQ